MAGIVLFSGTTESSKIIQLSSTTTLSSKIQFFPILTQFPMILAFMILLDPIMEYFPIVMEVNWEEWVIGGLIKTLSQIIEKNSILIVHKSDLIIHLGEITIFEAKILEGFLI